MADVVLIAPRREVGVSQPVRVVQVRPAAMINTGGGTASPRFVHTQTSASATWTVNHNLGFLPQVTVLSPGGIEVEATVEHVSSNQAVITFNTAQTGQAIFS